MHPRLRQPLHALTDEDIRALVFDRVNESDQLEFKRELPLKTEGQRKEAAKDISGLANAAGGMVIYGIEERTLDDGRRVPAAPSPLTDGSIQARLEDVLTAAIRPRIDFQSRLIETEAGYFLVIRVERRPGRVHMVQGYGDRRYYIRRGLKTEPMDQAEVERAHREDLDAVNRLEKRMAGLPLVSRPSGFELGTQPEWPWPQPWVGVVMAGLGDAERLFTSQGAGPFDFPLDGEGRMGTTKIRSDSWNLDRLGYADEDVSIYEEHPTSVKLSHRYDPPGGEIPPPEGPLSFLSRRVRLYEHGICEWGRVYQSEFSVPARTLLEDVHDVLGYFAGVFDGAGYVGPVGIWQTVRIRLLPFTLRLPPA